VLQCPETAISSLSFVRNPQSKLLLRHDKNDTSDGRISRTVQMIVPRCWGFYIHCRTRSHGEWKEASVGWFLGNLPHMAMIQTVGMLHMAVPLLVCCHESVAFVFQLIPILPTMIFRLKVLRTTYDPTKYPVPVCGVEATLVSFRSVYLCGELQFRASCLP
jgi:hypothetical protein